MSDESSDRLLRIGPFSRAVGVSAERLRNWERRYGLPRPQRSDGGFRLYSAADMRVVKAMLRELESGTAPAEAASIALSGQTETKPPSESDQTDGGGDTADRLREALERFDERAAQDILDTAFGRLSEEAALRDVVLPCMRAIGERWAAAEITVDQEHFASRLVEGRLLAAARGWERGGGPSAVLACPSGELHTIGLIAFGLILSRNGWRIVYLGADTPVEAVRNTTRRVRPDLVVLGSVDASRFAAITAELAPLGAETRLYLGGAGANAALAAAAGGNHLAEGAVEAALELHAGAGLA